MNNFPIDCLDDEIIYAEFIKFHAQTIQYGDELFAAYASQLSIFCATGIRYKILSMRDEPINSVDEVIKEVQVYDENGWIELFEGANDLRLSEVVMNIFNKIPENEWATIIIQNADDIESDATRSEQFTMTRRILRDGRISYALETFEVNGSQIKASNVVKFFNKKESVMSFIENITMDFLLDDLDDSEGGGSFYGEF